MHLHNCRCFQEHLRMLLQSLRALCLAPGGSGSIWKYLEALVRLSGVSGRIACGFRTDLHFADVQGCGQSGGGSSRPRRDWSCDTILWSTLNCENVENLVKCGRLRDVRLAGGRSQSILGVCCSLCMRYIVYAVLGVCCSWCMLYWVYPELSEYYTWCMLYSVYAEHGICLYSVYAVLSINSWSLLAQLQRDDWSLCS